MAFGPSGTLLRVEPNSKMLGLPTVLAAIPYDLRKNIHAYHANLLGQLANAGRRHFNSDIKRPGETGEGIGGNRKRQTGKFTFGTKAGGAFIGRLNQDEDKPSFGWPDVAHADQATRYVWRSLEHGLSGTSGRSSPGFYEGDSAYRSTAPRGVHQLPRAFHFTGPEGDPSSQLKLGYADPRHAHGNRRKLPSPRLGLGAIPLTKKYGKGFEGKFFIASAWTEVVKKGILTQKYKTIIRGSLRKAFP